MTIAFIRMQENLEKLYLNQISLSTQNLNDIFEALKDSEAAANHLIELGLFGSVQIQEATEATCRPIVDFLGLHAPHLSQFDIRVRPYQARHTVKFVAEHTKDWMGPQ